MKKILMALYLAMPLMAYAGFVMDEGVRPPAKKTQVVAEDEPAPAPAPVKAVAPAAAAVAPAPASKLPTASVTPVSPVVNGVALSSVLYIGAPDKEPVPLQGFGDDVKLSDAIRRIVPVDWHVFWKEDFLRKGIKDFRVKWSDGGTWVEHLNHFGNDLALTFEIDWGRKLILVGEDKNRTEALAALGENTTQASWVVKPGALLQDTLTEWTSQAGWAFVWGLPEKEAVRLQAGNTWHGDFKAAIYELIDSLPPTIRIRVVLAPENIPPLLHVTRDEGVRQ